MQQGLSASAAAFNAPAMRRLDQRAAWSERAGRLRRCALAPALASARRPAGRPVAAFGPEAASRVRLEVRLRVVGRSEGRRRQAAAGVRARHPDAVFAAGRWSGGLGVRAAMATVAVAVWRHERPQHTSGAPTLAPLTAEHAGLGLRAMRRRAHSLAGPGRA